MINKKVRMLIITYTCLTLSILGVVIGTKGIMRVVSTNQQIEKDTKYIQSIKSSINKSETKAKAYIKQENYVSAIKEYEKIEKLTTNAQDNIISKDKKVLNQFAESITEKSNCNIKKAEIYTLQGDKEKSSEILEKSLKETLKNFNDKTPKNNIENSNYSIQISSKNTSDLIIKLFLNGEREKALQYSKKYFEINNNFSKYTKEDFYMIKTMFSLYIINGDKDNAQKLLSDYEKMTNRVSEYYDIARMESILGHYDIALNFLEKSWKENKNVIEIYDYITELTVDKEVNIGRMILNLQEKDEDNLIYKEWLAICYVNDGEYEQADKIFKKIDESSICTSLLKIKALILQNEYEKAETQIDEFIKTNSEYTFMGYHLKGWLKLFDNQSTEALEYYNKSVKLNDSYTDNYTKLLPAILKQDNALFTSLQITEIQKNITDKPYEYMLYRILDKMTADKQNNYTNIVLGLNNNTSVFANLINERITKGDYSTALTYLNKYTNGKKNIPMNIQYLKSVLLFKNGEYDKAIDLTRCFYANNNNDYIALNNAACYYLIVEHNIDKSLLNAKAALDNCSNDDREIVDLNYRKIVNLKHQYDISDNKSLDIPEVQLLY